MKILDEFFVGKKKYVCISKIYIESKIINVCLDLYFDKRAYFIENSNGSVQEITDNATIEKVKSYFEVESKDVIFPKI